MNLEVRELKQSLERRDAYILELEGKLASLLDEDRWATAEQYLLAAWSSVAASATPPAAVAVPEGWDKGRYHYTTLFNAIAAAVSVNAGGSLGISVGAFENAMLAAATASPAATGGLSAARRSAMTSSKPWQFTSL